MGTNKREYLKCTTYAIIFDKKFAFTFTLAGFG